MTILFMVGRIILGAYFIMSGVTHFQKTDMLTGFAQSRGVKGARALTIISGVVLLLGGVAIILGLMPRPALLALAIFLTLAAFMIHHYWTIHDPQQKAGERINFMKNLALAAALLMALLIDMPWPWSIL
jgi:uncharacterized membrane protein YphA (DoxX/SURF4 family)